MSTTYYLRNKKKYEEYKGFEKFWDELIAKTKESIEEYCRKVDGWLVNADLAEDIIDDKISSLSYCPIYDDQYDTDFCSGSARGFVFRPCYIEGQRIYNMQELKVFSETEEAREYVIVDDCNEPFSYEDFFAKISDALTLLLKGSERS